MVKIKVLFVCIHNSARSQMAEEILNKYYGDRFYAESAGIEAGKMNPLAIAAMKEIDIDISEKKTHEVFDYFKEGRIYSYVITVCDETSAERCPVFPNIFQTIRWSFPDPSTFSGTEEERLAQTRAVRDEIKEKIDAWVASL
ncbi:MAG: arsenate reductase ArsC [Ignavibacteria bacterium]|nr:arsenate reductase ArsC [Ignavibacteria bacterium]